jgi:REP element-mobilizing transposase RayT
MAARSKQGVFEFRTHGGKREGAGRKRAGRARVAHGARPAVSRHVPVHVTLPTVAEVGRLRKRDIYRAVRRASITSVADSRTRGRCRICQISIQGNHIHLIVEADDKEALSRGMQGFSISCAKRINTALTKRTGRKRSGSVFADRYHAHALRTPREVRNCLGYVLNNFRHHGERSTFAGGRLDPFASGMFFGGWLDHDPVAWPADAQLVMVWRPRSWLLERGWRQHGLVSTQETPGS